MIPNLDYIKTLISGFWLSVNRKIRDVASDLESKIANECAAVEHAHDEYAEKNHTHDEYAANKHTHIEYATRDRPVFDYSISMHRAGKEGYRSVALGDEAEASGAFATALGSKGKASGDYSIASSYNEASGNYSTAFGAHTRANSDRQFVCGWNNEEDTDGKYGFIFGAPRYNEEHAGYASRNGFTIDWDGNGWFLGTVESTALILPSPSGKKFKITVDDTGTLTATEVT